MAAILELAEVWKHVSPLSVQEYHRFDEFNENGRRTFVVGVNDALECFSIPDLRLQVTEIFP